MSNEDVRLAVEGMSRGMAQRADGVWCGAKFSACGSYRYRLTRQWSAGGTVVFVLLNPSTADAIRDDPTIRRCIGFARRWGYGRLEVVNLFAWRATRPADLRRAAAPIGPENSRVLWDAVRRAERIVVAWGHHGAFQGAGHRLLVQLKRRIPRQKLVSLGWTQEGHPRHVLYLANAVQPRGVVLRRRSSG